MLKIKDGEGEMQKIEKNGEETKNPDFYSV